MKNKGFTLIELLVVISIIGILASVVIIQFPGATKKARDGRVISSMGQFRTQARIVYANRSDYTAVECTIDPSTRVCSNCDLAIMALCNDIGENAVDLFEIHMNNDANGYCASVQLSASGNFFCVDGAGDEEIVLRAKEYDEEPAQCKSGSGCEASNSCSCE